MNNEYPLKQVLFALREEYAKIQFALNKLAYLTQGIDENIRIRSFFILSSHLLRGRPNIYCEIEETHNEVLSRQVVADYYPVSKRFYPMHHLDSEGLETSFNEPFIAFCDKLEEVTKTDEFTSLVNQVLTHPLIHDVSLYYGDCILPIDEFGTSKLSIGYMSASFYDNINNTWRMNLGNNYLLMLKSKVIPYFQNPGAMLKELLNLEVDITRLPEYFQTLIATNDSGGKRIKLMDASPSWEEAYNDFLKLSAKYTIQETDKSIILRRVNPTPQSRIFR